MSDTPTKPSHAARNTGIGVAAVLLLYVLSTGPVARLRMKGHIFEDNAFFNALYVPLRWSFEHNASAEIFLDHT